MSATPVLVKFKDVTYDITSFLSDHPGGKDVLLAHNGKEIEEVMKEVLHSPYAYQFLQTLPQVPS